MDISRPSPVEAALGRWSEGPGPLHRKLTAAFREAIEHGYLPSGERLPSERELAARLAVSRSTVVTAYDALRAEGLLESRQGSGTRIRSFAQRNGGSGGGNGGVRYPGPPVSSTYRSLISRSEGLISLATAILPAHHRVAEAFRTVIAEEADELFSYTGYAPAGLPALREAVAEMLTAGGTPTIPEQVVVTTGAQQAVTLACAVFVRPGDDVVVESPSFAGTIDVFRHRGARIASAPVDDDGVDVGAVRDLVAARHPSALYVMPSFHNPSGALMSEHRRRTLAALAGAKRVPIIEDNALEHTPLADDPLLRPIAAFGAADDPILSAGSLSKVAWGGLRVGWLRGPEPLISRVGDLKAMTDLGSPVLEQAVAVRVLPHLAEMRADNRVALCGHLELLASLLADELPDWEWRRPRGGPSLWIRLPSGTAAAFAQVALRHGVEVIPGEVMSPTADHRNYLRFPFTAEPPVLEETVRRLAAAWRDYTPRDPARAPSRTVVV